MREIRQPLLLPRHRLRKCRNSQHGSLIRWRLTPQSKPRRRRRERAPEPTYARMRYQTLNARTALTRFKNRREGSTKGTPVVDHTAPPAAVSNPRSILHHNVRMRKNKRQRIDTLIDAHVWLRRQDSKRERPANPRPSPCPRPG